MSEGTTLGQYMYWLSQIGGRCNNGIKADPSIGMVPVIKLVGPSGRHVIHSGDDQTEILSPSLIDYLDRRLEVVSPFKSVPRA